MCVCGGGGGGKGQTINFLSRVSLFAFLADAPKKRFQFIHTKLWTIFLFLYIRNLILNYRGEH